MIATKVPKAIIKVNASYVVILSPPNGGTDHQDYPGSHYSIKASFVLAFFVHKMAL